MNHTANHTAKQIVAKKRSQGPHGVVVVDKPAGWTSHDVVAKMRGIIGTGKIGHSGTLDPDATGVLVLGVGQATRLLRYLVPLPKSYEAEIVLGVETSTLDAAGVVTAHHDMAAVTDAEVQRAAATLCGEIMQIPPMVSALKVDGKRLYELARAGQTVVREPRPVTVSRYDVTPVEGDRGVWRCVVDCSSGTYVRTLAADLGAALGGGAHLRSLRRTSVGGFGLDAASTIEKPTLLPVSAAVAHLDRVEVGGELVTGISHGRIYSCEQLGATGEGPWAVFDQTAALLAVYEAHRHGAKPTVVLA